MTSTHPRPSHACVRENVFTEKPVLGWRAVREAAEASKIGWLHVGLRRVTTANISVRAPTVQRTP